MKSAKILIITFCSFTFSFAQENVVVKNYNNDYKTAIGLRAGGTSGLTFKQFIGGSTALEGIVGIWNHGFSFTVLYEKYSGTTLNGLSCYYGLGGHAAFNNSYVVHYHGRYDHYHYRNGSYGIGIDGVLGLEYKIPAAPIAISLDVKPFLEFVDNGNVWVAIDPGLGFKVAF